MNLIVLQVERDAETGSLVASWDDPAGGGFTTQGNDLGELEENIHEAILCHFDEGSGLEFTINSNEE